MELRGLRERLERAEQRPASPRPPERPATSPYVARALSRTLPPVVNVRPDRSAR